MQLNGLKYKQTFILIKLFKENLLIYIQSIKQKERDHRVMSVTDGHQSYQPSATFDRFRAWSC